ncbi:MAG: PDZ domain-containing protein [Phycisphaerales bacterium]
MSARARLLAAAMAMAPLAFALPASAQQVRVGDRRPRGLESIPITTTQDPVPWSPTRLEGVAPDPAVTALVRDLDARDFAVRAKATTALHQPAVPDEQLYVHLARGGLSAEAHARLLQVARSRLLNAPRGALGIQMASRVEETDGVTVTALVPNMPAQKVLRPGDRIVRIDGHPIRVAQQLTAVVQLRRPGDRVKVLVMRGERDELGRVKGGPDGRPVETPVEVELELGSREDLDRFGDGGVDVPQIDGGRDRLATLLSQAFPGPVLTLPVEPVAGETPDVDSHPDIAQLKELVEHPEQLQGGAGMRAMLRARLSALEAAARIPGLSPAEQAWLQAVADRFRALIPPELRPDAPAEPAAREPREQ